MRAAVAKWDRSQNRILKIEEIEEDDFKGESRRDAKKLEQRALHLSTGVRAYLRFKTRKLVRELTGEIKNTGKVLRVRKAVS